MRKLPLVLLGLALPALGASRGASPTGSEISITSSQIS
jgi:hypothetical protein